MVKKLLLWVGTSIVAIAILIFLLFKFTPWPSALLIRYAFTKGGIAMNEALVKHTPNGVTLIADQHYDTSDADAFLDVYFPSSISNKNTILPVIVWIHGGGWVSGTKSETSNYYRILAAKGFVVVSIDYSIAPEKKYPTPILQTNAALAFLKQNAREFHIDPSSFFLAGDSGGAQIAAQMANIISNVDYSQLMGISPAINRRELSGLILYCGPYDAALADLKGDFGSFLKTVLWAYSGTKDFEKDTLFKRASIIDYVDQNFPPAFISVGNGDPLASHSLNLARKLKALKAPIDTLFFAADYKPLLPHEYQFNLDLDAGHIALNRSVMFVNKFK